MCNLCICVQTDLDSALQSCVGFTRKEEYSDVKSMDICNTISNIWKWECAIKWIISLDSITNTTHNLGKWCIYWGNNDMKFGVIIYMGAQQPHIRTVLCSPNQLPKFSIDYEGWLKSPVEIRQTLVDKTGTPKTKCWHLALSPHSARN
jgi:hypothetical protein